MTSTMPEPGTRSSFTRPSLVAGLQSGDEGRWHEFFRTYGPLVRGFALKAGLTETEADEVVQETCIGVARNVGEYRYDPARCRFKTWLLNLASWRVKNQFTKRRRWDERLCRPEPGDPESRVGASPTPALDRLPAAPDPTHGTLWEEEWRATLLRAALEKVRGETDATHFQIFDLRVLKEWPASEVAASLGVSTAAVYLAKHRVSAAIRKEIARIERRMEQGASACG